MRDGVMLYTVILVPVSESQPYPFLINRTPYSADSRLPAENGLISLSDQFAYANLAAEGYIFVFQDIRGNSKVKEPCRFISPLFIGNKRVR